MERERVRKPIRTEEWAERTRTHLRAFREAGDEWQAKLQSLPPRSQEWRSTMVQRDAAWSQADGLAQQLREAGYDTGEEQA